MTLHISGAQAKAARDSLGLSQGFVASETAISRTYLSQFENSKYLLPDDDLHSLRDFYIDMGYSFSESDSCRSEKGTQNKSDPDLPGCRRIDNFLSPTGLNDEYVGALASELAVNRKRIEGLLEYDLRKNHGKNALAQFLTGDEPSDEVIEAKLSEVVHHMARSYMLVELLRGSASFAVELTGEDKPGTTAEFLVPRLELKNAD